MKDIKNAYTCTYTCILIANLGCACESQITFAFDNLSISSMDAILGWVAFSLKTFFSGEI